MDLWTLSYAVLWFLVLLEGAVLVLLLRSAGTIFLSSREGISRDGIVLGKRAPEFDAMESGGGPVSLQDFRGRWLVLVFAGTSCRICWDLVPKLRTLRDAMKDTAEVLVMLRDDVAAASEYATATGHVIPIVAIGRRGIAQTYKVRVSPFVHVVDPNGIVRAKGLVNEVEHLEHLMYETGIRHPRLRAHGRSENSEATVGV